MQAPGAAESPILSPSYHLIPISHSSCRACLPLSEVIRNRLYYHLFTNCKFPTTRPSAPPPNSRKINPANNIEASREKQENAKRNHHPYPYY